MRDNGNYNAFRINHNTASKPFFLDTKSEPPPDFSEGGSLLFAFNYI